MRHQKELELKIDKLNKITIGLVFAYTFVIIFSSMMDLSAQPIKFRVITAIVTVFVFLSLGIGFLATGLLMIFAIKNHFTEFYIKVGCILWAATMLLAVPMFLRGINWYLILKSDNYANAYDKHIAESNAIYCILTTIFPVCA